MRLLKQDANKPAKLLLETEQGTGNGAIDRHQGIMVRSGRLAGFSILHQK
jgi:hypothetical protein